MGLIDSLLLALPADPIEAHNVVIGLHWTLVTSKYGGLSSTMAGEGPHGHARIKDVGSLHKKSAQELAGWLSSDNLLEASIGAAALNSLLDVDESRLEEINAAEVIARESRDKDLVIVGHFPFVEKMKTIAKNCWVIEKRPYGDDFPEEAAQEYIPQADMVAITGTALINHTIDGLLALCRPGAAVMVLGPSTPLSPLLYEYGISYICGSRVTDADAVIATIQQGATLPQVKGVRQVTMTNHH